MSFRLYFYFALGSTRDSANCCPECSQIPSCSRQFHQTCARLMQSMVASAGCLPQTKILATPVVTNFSYSYPILPRLAATTTWLRDSFFNHYMESLVTKAWKSSIRMTGLRLIHRLNNLKLSSSVTCCVSM